ncbi:MAG TPA: hypothetical protein VK638_36805 [Edaphobacter sp.]|nr:hypothetical protein [Edaphobacter sp.]
MGRLSYLLTDDYHSRKLAEVVVKYGKKALLQLIVASAFPQQDLFISPFLHYTLARMSMHYTMQ